MDGIKLHSYQKKQEAMQTRHAFQLRKENREMRAELDKLKEQNQAAVKRIEKEYNQEAFQEQAELETKLNEIRKKNERIIENEENRYEKMREETILTHEQQLEELQLAHEKEIQSQKEKHQEYIENARRRLEAEKMKLEG